MVLIKQGNAWTNVSLQNYRSEDELQSLLASAPELIPGCAGNLTVRELRIPGTGLLDLLCVDESGSLTLVECKLATNPHIRRSVVGQIFAYASGLSDTSFDELSRNVEARTGSSLTNLIKQAASGEVDEGRFQDAVSENLASGTFRLVLAVDEITDELKAIVEYLNRHLSDSVSLVAIELGYLPVEKDTQILVPATYGAEIAEHKKPASSRRWTEEDIHAALAELPEAAPRSLLEQLLSEAKSGDVVFKGGTGADPSGGFYYAVEGKRISVWSLYMKDSGPVISLNLGSISRVSEARALAVLSRLRECSALAERLDESDQDAMTRYPGFPLAELPDASSATAAIQKAIHEATTGPS